MTEIKLSPTEKEIIETLQKRLVKMPEMEPRNACSAWYFPVVFGERIEPKLLAMTMKRLCSLGLLKQLEDDKGFPSFVPTQTSSGDGAQPTQP